MPSPDTANSDLGGSDGPTTAARSANGGAVGNEAKVAYSCVGRAAGDSDGTATISVLLSPRSTNPVNSRKADRSQWETIHTNTADTTIIKSTYLSDPIPYILPKKLADLMLLTLTKRNFAHPTHPTVSLNQLLKHLRRHKPLGYQQRPPKLAIYRITLPIRPSPSTSDI